MRLHLAELTALTTAHVTFLLWSECVRACLMPDADESFLTTVNAPDALKMLPVRTLPG
jgi:hypothetical protein